METRSNNFLVGVVTLILLIVTVFVVTPMNALMQTIETVEVKKREPGCSSLCSTAGCMAPVCRPCCPI